LTYVIIAGHFIHYFYLLTVNCHLHSLAKHALLKTSAVTVSIFGFVVGFGQFKKNKNSSLRSVSVFMVPDVNHTHSKL